MATISLSPTPAHINSAMSQKRGPLTNNANAANSPLRGVSRDANGLPVVQKPKRSLAEALRQEHYGQPPLKKQALEHGSQRPKSPSKVPRPQFAVQRDALTTVSRVSAVSKSYTSASKANSMGKTSQDMVTWKAHYKAKFPKMVFYFESVPDDVRARLTKRISYLGARQEPFFSNEVTHVITTRPIPSGNVEQQQREVEQQENPAHEEPKTINPSLLDRTAGPLQRKLFADFRQTKTAQSHDSLRLSNLARNNDVLHKAIEMGKKIWSLDKFMNMVNVLLEAETQHSTVAKTLGPKAVHGTAKEAGHLLTQMLQHERINGPSDRDPTASNREMHYFRGPYLYVWDMDEKQKPMLVREYNKVALKTDGDWPQFRSVGNGRCPFVEEADVSEKKRRKAEQDKLTEKEKERAQETTAVAKKDEKPASKTNVPLLKPVTGNAQPTRSTHVLNPARVALSKRVEARHHSTVPSLNAFTSRALGGPLYDGEPVASGIQKNTVTSAIRSQMISSQAGMSGVKAGTSKEIHGLQRQVLRKTAPASQTSSRQATEASAEPSSRPAALCRTISRTMVADEDARRMQEIGDRPPSQPLKSKKDLKPGYCENCQDKFRDFDEHVVSREHRRFAENNDNWAELDHLITQLKRIPRPIHMDMEYDFQ